MEALRHWWSGDHPKSPALRATVNLYKLNAKTIISDFGDKSYDTTSIEGLLNRVKAIQTVLDRKEKHFESGVAGKIAKVFNKLKGRFSSTAYARREIQRLENEKIVVADSSGEQKDSENILNVYYEELELNAKQIRRCENHIHSLVEEHNFKFSSDENLNKDFIKALSKIRLQEDENILVACMQKGFTLTDGGRLIKNEE